MISCGNIVHVDARYLFQTTSINVLFMFLLEGSLQDFQFIPKKNFGKDRALAVLNFAIKFNDDFLTQKVFHKQMQTKVQHILWQRTFSMSHLLAFTSTVKPQTDPCLSCSWQYVYLRGWCLIQSQRVCERPCAMSRRRLGFDGVVICTGGTLGIVVLFAWLIMDIRIWFLMHLVLLIQGQAGHW